MNLFNLVAKLSLDDTEYKNKISGAKKSADGLTSAIAVSSKKSAAAMGAVGVAALDVGKKMEDLSMASIAGGLKTAAGWVGVALSITAVVSSLKDAIYNTTEWAGGIKDLAQVYGMTYRQVQEVNYLAQESGKNAEWALRKAQSSGENYWEVLGLTNEQYREMIGYAEEMGIILGDKSIDGADRLGDKLSQLKYQWQSLLAGLLAGDEDAEANLQKFFGRLMSFLEEFTPEIIQFSVELLRQIVVGLIKIAPQLISELLTAVLNVIWSVDWLQVGWDLMKTIAEGIINASSEFLFGWLGGIFGFEAPKVDFGVGNTSYIKADTQSVELTERSSQELTIKLESNGVTANDKAVTNALEDLIDEKIGNMLGGVL